MNNQSNMSGPDFDLTQKLREHRERLGLSQTEVAHRLTDAGIRMSQTAMSRVEKGERALTVGEAQAYAAALHTSLEALLKGDSTDELIADGLATLRSLEIARSSALKSLNEHTSHIQQLRHIMREAIELADDPSTPETQRVRLRNQDFYPASSEPEAGDETLDVRIARVLEAIEKSLIDDLISLSNEGKQPL